MHDAFVTIAKNLRKDNVYEYYTMPIFIVTNNCEVEIKNPDYYIAKDGRGFLITRQDNNGPYNMILVNQEKTFPATECPICFNELTSKSLATFQCGHKQCTNCIAKQNNPNELNFAPLCIEANLKCALCNQKNVCLLLQPDSQTLKFVKKKSDNDKIQEWFDKIKNPVVEMSLFEEDTLLTTKQNGQGGFQRTHIRFQKKTYKVYHRADKTTYIRCNKQVLNLSSIRNRYRYVTR